MTASILQRVADITGLNDTELGSVIGKARATVQAYRTGILPEYLDGRQSVALRRCVALYRDQILQDISELEVLL